MENGHASGHHIHILDIRIYDVKERQRAAGDFNGGVWPQLPAELLLN